MTIDSNVLDRSDLFAARIRANRSEQIALRTAALLDAVSMPDCEKIADWAFDNFSFGTDLLKRIAGYGWHRKNEGETVVLSRMLNTARIGYDRVVEGEFAVTFNPAGKPISAVQSGTDSHGLIKEFGKAPDFALIAGIDDLTTLTDIRVPVISVTEQRLEFADWALRQFDGLTIDNKASPWMSHQMAGMLTMSKDVKIATFGKLVKAVVRFGDDGEPTHVAIQPKSEAGQRTGLQPYQVIKNLPTLAEFELQNTQSLKA